MSLFQISLAIMIFYEAIKGNGSEDYHELAKMPDSTWIVFARFVCGTVLHIHLQAEL